ncbi:MAG TPA: hypothetical protein HA263_10220 [Methanoregulaceae archaeon]|nr:hypothetical protein [Methanoregulaceae archaeon]
MARVQLIRVSPSVVALEAENMDRPLESLTVAPDRNPEPVTTASSVLPCCADAGEMPVTVAVSTVVGRAVMVMRGMVAPAPGLYVSPVTTAESVVSRLADAGEMPAPVAVVATATRASTMLAVMNSLFLGLIVCSLLLGIHRGVTTTVARTPSGFRSIEYSE